jgi:predicted RNase H-like HicB family nuclease
MSSIFHRHGAAAMSETGQAVQTGHPVTIEVTVKVQALAIPEPAGGYSVIVPSLPGCFTDGQTVEEAQAHAAEAAEAWLDSQHDHRKGEALRVALGE